jgi:hypothetical protein
MPATTLDEQLPALHAHYTARINAAVAAGRMDLVRDLADECRDEALALILAAEGPSRRSGDRVEILEAGGWPHWSLRRRARWRGRRHG